MDLSRIDLLIGKTAINKLKSSKIIVIGVGGVGGITSEMLVRSGIGEITIVDFDKIAPSNINRQIMAFEDNIGKLKVDELATRLKAINSKLKVNTVSEKLCEENLEKYNLKSYDFIIDAIDSVKDKLALIKYAYNNKIKIISAMGTGNKICAPSYEIVDIFKTQNDGLAKVMRKLLKENGIKSHKVCYSKQDKLSVKGLGSVVWHPTACACVIVSEVINELIKES